MESLYTWKMCADINKMLLRQVKLYNVLNMIIMIWLIINWLCPPGVTRGAAATSHLIGRFPGALSEHVARRCRDGSSALADVLTGIVCLKHLQVLQMLFVCVAIGILDSVQHQQSLQRSIALIGLETPSWVLQKKSFANRFSEFNFFHACMCMPFLRKMRLWEQTA